MSEHIRISGISDKERRRRRRELLAAAFCFLLIAVLTWIELKYIGSDSYLYLGLLNLNFILLLVILFIVTRNGVKLLLERRRKVLGSKLRTRLVLAFISLTLIPMALMFLVSLRFVQTSVDYWFTGQVDESMVQTLELGRTFFRSAQDRLERRGSNVIEEIIRQKYAWGGKGMNKLLDTKKDEYDLSLLLVVTPKGTDQNVHMAESWKDIWEATKSKINWKEIVESDRPWSTIVPNPESDLILCVLPVDKGKTGFLVLGETVGRGISHRLDRIVRGLDEYKKLKSLKYPWKMTLYLTLGVMTMLIILGAVWFGFRLAKEISAPIQALAAGTERIARGDLSVRLEDRSDDELGFLVQSFNRMVEDLDSSQEIVQKANERLAVKNLELEQHYKYVEAVLNNITSGVISMDARGRIGTVNTAAETMIGVPGEFLINKKPRALLSGDFADLMQEALDQMAANPDSQWQRQLDLQTPGGMRRMLVTVVSLKASSKEERGIVAVFEDITELEKIQRLAAWREVARRIAHEIKNPLTPIKLSAQRLQRNYAESVNEKVFDDCTDLIVKQVERLQGMVTEFSAYAKLPEVQPRPDFLAPLIEEVVDMFANTHRRIEWKLEFSSTIEEIPFDHEALRKVLINLLTNAAEALDDSGTGCVNIVAGHDKVQGVVTIEVRDNGPGLPQGSGSRLFEPYFSHKKGGTGLGLTIVRSIVADHGGNIRAESLPKGGTAFILKLPDA